MRRRNCADTADGDLVFSDTRYRSDLLEPLDLHSVGPFHDHRMSIGQMAPPTNPPVGIPRGRIPVLARAGVGS